MITFHVPGEPLPKQSFRYAKNGGYTPQRVKAWQDTVSLHARQSMQGDPPLEGDLEVEISFTRSTNRRADLDNLSKAVLDAMNGIVYQDDQQIKRLILHKYIDKKKSPGAFVVVGTI